MTHLRDEVTGLAASGVLIQALTIFSGPFAARLLGVEGRGALAASIAIASLAAILATGGLPTAIAICIASSRGSAARDVVRGRLRNQIKLVAPACLGAGVFTYFAFRNPGGLPLAIATATLVVVMMVHALVTAMIRGEGNSSSFNRLRLIGTSSYMLMVVFLFLSFESVTPAVFVILFSTSFCVGIGYGWRRLRRPTYDSSLRVGRAALSRNSAAHYVATTGPVDSWGIDLLLVGALLGPAPLGLYAVGRSVTTLPFVMLHGISQSLAPRLAITPPAARAHILKSWIFRGLLLNALAVAGIQAIIGPVITLAFGKAFSGAVLPARVLVMAWSLLALRRLLLAAAQGLERGQVASRVETLTLAILVPAVALGATVGGTLGASTALVFVAAGSCLGLTRVVLRSRDAPPLVAT